MRREEEVISQITWGRIHKQSENSLTELFSIKTLSRQFKLRDDLGKVLRVTEQSQELLSQ